MDNNIMDLMNFKETEKFWLVDKKNDMIKNNPFYIKNGCLYDINNVLSDDILGKYCRDEVFIKRIDDSIIKDNSVYYFINENLEIRKTKNKNQLIDMFNILIGNMFFSEEYITPFEIERVSSIYEMIKFNKTCIFPYKIQNEQNLLNKILINVNEDNLDNNIIDEKNKYRNIFKKNL